MAMLDLSVKPDPFDIVIEEGASGRDITFHVTPMDLRSFYIAQAEARHRLTELEEGIEQCAAAGLINEEGLPDVKNPVVRDGVFQEFLSTALAKRHIVSWTGVKRGDDTDVEVNERNIEAAFRNVIVATRFHDKFMTQHAEFLRAKKDSGIVAGGISDPAAVPVIAKGANATD